MRCLACAATEAQRVPDHYFSETKLKRFCVQGMPLYIAVILPHVQMVQALLSYGADMQLTSGLVGALFESPPQLCQQRMVLLSPV